MSDSDDLELGDDGASPEMGGPSKKSSGLGALLPTLLKFVAIGVGALIFIVTVAVITFNIMNKGGSSQTVLPENSPYIGKRPEYSMFTSIGVIRTRTKDPTPFSVVVDMVIGYDMNDRNAQTEFTTRLYELRDFVRNFFSNRYAEELQSDNEARLKQEIIEALNTRLFVSSKARIILFNQLDVIETM
jgi:flagellar FliL protein